MHQASMRLFNKSAVAQINKIAATRSDNYKKIDLGISQTDEETANVISGTYGVISNDCLAAQWYSEGFNPNVNAAYEKVMSDESQMQEINGRIYYRHPGVGTCQKYNENGNPPGGFFSLYTMA